jgi:hypothetical protein
MEFAHITKDLKDHLVSAEAGYKGISNLDNDIHRLWRMENFRIGDVQHETELLKNDDPALDLRANRTWPTTRLSASRKLRPVLLQSSYEPVASSPGQKDSSR